MAIIMKTVKEIGQPFDLPHNQVDGNGLWNLASKWEL